MAIVNVYSKDYPTTLMLNSFLRIVIENGNKVKLYDNQCLYNRIINKLEDVVDYGKHSVNPVLFS